MNEKQLLLSTVIFATLFGVASASEQEQKVTPLAVFPHRSVILKYKPTPKKIVICDASTSDNHLFLYKNFDIAELTAKYVPKNNKLEIKFKKACKKELTKKAPEGIHSEKIDKFINVNTKLFIPSDGKLSYKLKNVSEFIGCQPNRAIVGTAYLRKEFLEYMGTEKKYGRMIKKITDLVLFAVSEKPVPESTLYTMRYNFFPLAELTAKYVPKNNKLEIKFKKACKKELTKKAPEGIRFKKIDKFINVNTRLFIPSDGKLGYKLKNISKLIGSQPNRAIVGTAYLRKEFLECMDTEKKYDKMIKKNTAQIIEKAYNRITDPKTPQRTFNSSIFRQIDPKTLQKLINAGILSVYFRAINK